MGDDIKKETGTLSQRPGPTSTYEKQPFWKGIKSNPILVPINKTRTNSLKTMVFCGSLNF